MIKTITKSILVIAVCLIIASCGDDNEATPEVSIVGTWTATSITRENCTDAADNSTINFDCANNFCEVFVFNSDGTAEETYTDPNNGVSSSKGTYTLSGNKLTFCKTDGSECETVTIELSADKLVVATFEEDEAGSGEGCDLILSFNRTN